MDRTLQSYNSPLIVELGNWNRQEQKFRELFSDESLKDRDFLKLKLAEYTRISYRHAQSASTVDERALVTMLAYQRKKLRQALYPGFLRRLVARAYGFAREMVHKHLLEVKPVRGTNYELPSIPVEQIAPVSKPSENQREIRPEHKQQPNRRPHQQQPRKNRSHHKKKGRAI